MPLRASSNVRNPYSGGGFTYPLKADTRASSEEWAKSAAEFDANLALIDYQNMYNEEYNNPSAIASRLRDAGINPDLAGLNGDPGVTSAGASAPSVNGGQRTSPIALVDSLGKIVNEGLALYAQYQDIQSKSLDIDLKRAGAAKQYVDLGMQQIQSELPYLADVASGSTGDLRSTHFSPNFKVPRKIRKQVNAILDNYIDSDAFQSQVNQYRFDNSNNFADNPQEFEEVLGYINKLKGSFMKYQLSESVNRSKYNSEYYGNIDGSLDASVKKFQGSSYLSQNEIKKEVNDTLNSLMERMSKSTNPIVTDFLQPVVGLLFMYFQNGGGIPLPSISTSDTRYGKSFKLGF